MKKIISIILMMVTMSAIFAYEPKAECAKVDKKRNVKYTETYYASPTSPTAQRSFTIKKNGTFILFNSGTFDGMWNEISSARRRWESALYLSTVKPYRSCSYCNFLEKYKDEYENNLLNEEEKYQYELLVKQHSTRGCVDDMSSGIFWKHECERIIKRVVDRIPFITEENFFTLTKEEMLNKLNDFINNLY